MRFEEAQVCRECRAFSLNCPNSQKCKEVRAPLRDYNGIRNTADGFDCALPVTIDSHSVCAYECLYCFSDNILGHSAVKGKDTVGQTSLNKLERIFAGEGGKDGEHFRKSLKYDKRNASGYPCPVQLGGLCDAGDSIEQNQGWLLKFINLAVKYNQPVRMSTKSGIFLLPDYQKAIMQAPHLFWVAFSIITNDDAVAKQVERFAPSTSQRFQAMEWLSSHGVKTSLRMRPIMQGITDKGGGHRILIDRAAKAGAKAISYEVGFYPMTLPKEKKWKWELMNRIAGRDFKKIYSSFGKLQACTRPSYLWTEEIMHDIHDYAKKNGLDVGVSDPVWKQLNDFGCCCGINPADPVFGNWQENQATNRLVESMRTGKLIHLEDIVPAWAYDYLASKMINFGAGPKIAYIRRHLTWADILKETWNNPTAERGPLTYFQGAIRPVEKDANGNVVYKFFGLKREHRRAGWEIPKGAIS